MTDLLFLLIDAPALLIEWTLRLIFWLGRKLGWIKQSAPKPTRPQTIIGALVLLAVLAAAGLAR